MTRRDVIQLMAVSPLAAAAGACCPTKYQRAGGASPPAAVADSLDPLKAATARAAGVISAIDVHAHFFNGSDVPVRGFVHECIGHNAPRAVQPLVFALAALADAIAERAPTAAAELGTLGELGKGARVAADPSTFVRDRAQEERDAAIGRVLDVLREKPGRRFEQEYLRLKGGTAPSTASAGVRTITRPDVERVLDDMEKRTTGTARVAGATVQAQGDAADGLLAFLKYMLSSRWSNVRTYADSYTLSQGPVRIDTVLGSLVDFDYWLDCPPRSPHEQQIELHHVLSTMFGRHFFRPVVAYNPWTDIAQGGAGLARVEHACTKLGFVAVKIYPPTGFMPAGNATGQATVTKRHPDLTLLDGTLKRFFARCAELEIPIIAHTAHSNGRDRAHDEFGGPDGWKAMLAQHAEGARSIVDFGHFGGGQGPGWTSGFAALMRTSKAALFGDLGYWEELMCLDPKQEPCRSARKRLKDVLSQPVEGGGVVADRVMFGTDWLMLSQVKRWADYPAALLGSLRDITDGSDEIVGKIMRGNAMRCFRLSTR